MTVCEMEDADDVLRILMERAREDLALRIAVRQNWQTAPRALSEAVKQMASACDDFLSAAALGILTGIGPY
jgi:hypothetical protein